MAEDPQTYSPNTAQVNRARMQGNGVGQQDMDMQQDPNRDTYATNPQRTDAFGDDPQGGGDDLGADNGRNVSGTGNSVGDEGRSFDEGRDAAGVNEAGDLGSGTPANVDIHDIGQSDNPEEEWGEGAPGAVHGQTNTKRPDRTEAERGQGARTRQLNKDIISRRT
jgi:hypothetical protein